MELLPHACKLCYYAWKPLVIAKALAHIEKGSMLLFMDANLQKYKASGWSFLSVVLR